MRASSAATSRRRAGDAGDVEDHAVPGLHRVVGEVAARVVGEVRRADQLAAEVVGPAVQRADDVRCRCCRGRAASPPGDAGRRSRPAAGPPAYAAGHGLRPPGAARSSRRPRARRARGRRSAGAREQPLAFAREEVGIEVAADGKRRLRGGERFAGDAQVGHGGGKASKGRRPRLAPGWRRAASRRSKGRGLYPATSGGNPCGPGGPGQGAPDGPSRRPDAADGAAVR